MDGPGGPALHGQRTEDVRFLTGRGRFMADLLPPGVLQAVFVRADRAPARLLRLDTGPALAVPGVVAVLGPRDLAAWGTPPLPQDPLPQDEGGPAFARPVPLLCEDLVRHPGEPLALVLAETEDAARDGAEAVGVVLEETDDPPVTAFVRTLGDAAATRAALAAAAHVVRRAIAVPRVHALPLEPRGCLARPGPDGRLHLLSSTQNPPALLKPLAEMLGLPADRVRVMAGDVGGSFGLKGFLTREEALVALAALRLGRPVGWTATRSESLLADHRGRGVTGEVTLGFDADLRIVALSGRMTLDAGAYVSRRSLGIVNNAGGLAGVYDIPAAHLRLDGVTSPSPPVAPYRGHGRPEMTLAIELALDSAARHLGVCPVELRRRNLLRPARLPRRTALGFTLDCGDFPAVLDRVLALSAGAEARAAGAAARGRLFGRGVICCIEAAGGPARAPRPDHAVLTIDPKGTVTLAPGAMSVGQGHETVLARLAAARLGIEPGRILWRGGDTDAVPDGRGNGGSSALAVCGPAVVAACDGAVAQARALAAAVWGCAVDSVAWDGGLLRCEGTNRTLTPAEVAARAGPAGIVARGSFAPPAATYPNGAHVAEVEIDPETGMVEVTRYWAVEDVGTVLDPVLVDGQMQGGIAQGLAQVLGERMVTGAGGQVLTGSLMDYALPRAGDLPAPRLETHPVPTAVNPLGVKGVGEAGTVGALAAGMSAVGDALARAGVGTFDMPASPARVWTALRAAPRGG